MKDNILVLLLFFAVSCAPTQVVTSFDEAQTNGIDQHKKLLVIFDCEKACSGSGKRTRQLLDIPRIREFSSEYIFTYLLTDDQNEICQDSKFGKVDCDAKRQVDLTKITSQPLICVINPSTDEAIVFRHWITETDSLVHFLVRNK